jgi:hypothetical protein
MNVTRFTRNASAAVVAGIAGYASYWHQVAVATRAGERAELAHIVPLSVDGVLVVASIVMVDARHEGRYPHWVTRIGFAIGILASVSANIASALPTWLGRAEAAWPAFALLLVVEMLSRRGRLMRESAATAPSVTAPVQQQAETVIRQAATVLPVPVSPGPVGLDDDDDDERSLAGRRPIARRPAVSPLTGRVMSERAPRV